jgi:uncharacterized membrane protein YfcA
MSYLVICLVSFLVAILTLFSGFGLGTLLLPAFSFFFPIEIAVAATAVVHLANNIFKFFLVGRMAVLPITLKFAIPAAITAALGAWVLTQMGVLPNLATYELVGHVFIIEPVKLTIGILIAIFSLFEFIPSLQKAAFPAKYIPLGGAISGFFGGLSGLQGALRSMFLIRAGLNKNQFVGTTVVSSIIVDLSRLVVYGFAMFGRHFEELKISGALGLVASAVGAACVGSILGTQLLPKVTLKTIQNIVGVLLFFVALGLIGGLL